MIRLVCFQSEPLQNANCYARQIADAFYTRGFEFDCVTTAYPENAGTFADLALADNNDLWVFFDPPAPYKAENIRLIFKDTLKSDCSFVLTELEGITGKHFGKFFFKLFGADNAEIAAACNKVRQAYPNASVRYNVSGEYGDKKIEIIYDNTTPKMVVDGVTRIFAEELDSYVYAEEDVTLEVVLNRLLKLRGKRLSVAESFTSGRVAAAVISVPGASSHFHEGIVAYSNISKELRLGVNRDTLSDFGAVSSECCSEMVLGLLDTGRCDIAISTTGIAGPASDNTKKPVGLCYIGVGTEDGVDVYKYRFNGDRVEITETAIKAALFNAVKKLKYL